MLHIGSKTLYEVAFRLFSIKISYDTFFKFVIYSPTVYVVGTYTKTWFHKQFRLIIKLILSAINLCKVLLLKSWCFLWKRIWDSGWFLPVGSCRFHYFFSTFLVKINKRGKNNRDSSLQDLYSYTMTLKLCGIFESHRRLSILRVKSVYHVTSVVWCQ